MSHGAQWDVGERLALASEVADLHWVSVLEDDYGVVTGTGVGATQAQANSAGINSAALAAGDSGVLCCPPDVTIEIDGGLQFGGHVRMAGASFNWVGAVDGVTALTVRDFKGGSARLLYKAIDLPDLNGIGSVHTYGAGADLWGTTKGLELCGLMDCEVRVGRVWGFATGVILTERNNQSSLFNTIFLGSLAANKVGVYLYCNDLTASGAAVNDNLFIGGNVGWGSDMTYGLSGTIGIRLDEELTKNTIDNNVFLKTCVEGDPEYLIFLKRASNNVFLNVRLESNGGLSKIRFDQYAHNNHIWPGASSYINNGITVEKDSSFNGAGANRIHEVARIRGSMSPTLFTLLDRADQFSFGPLIGGVPNAGGTFSIDPTAANPGIKAGPGDDPGDAIETMDTSLYRQSAGKWYTPNSFQAATLVLPSATSPAQTAEGAVVWDSDDDHLTVGTGAGRKTLANTDEIGGSGVSSFAKSGDTALTGAVTIAGGSGILLTESGQNVTIAATGSAAAGFLAMEKWGVS